MLNSNFVLTTALLYVGVLFVLAFYSDRRARQGKDSFLSSPLVYTLSLSVYCTSWTFYGAVGSAARNGLEFAAIYLGPTLVFVGWWFLLRKLVHIGNAHRITSIADFISSRFGKSPALAALVTVIAVMSTTPYIALQLKAVTTSFQVVSGNTGIGGNVGPVSTSSGFWIAILMAIFTILFGTRNLNANERNPGVVAAIAFEALVKLFAILAVGVFVVFTMSGGVAKVFEYESAAVVLQQGQSFGWRWVNLLLLSSIAIVCLPRQFQTTVVENANEDHLRTASWAFPLYLFLMSLFVIPIAIVGLAVLPANANPDMFLLTLPIFAGQEALAMLAFIGGFSSATSMVIVASMALSIMISNHIVVPVALHSPFFKLDESVDIKHFILISRRISIGVILFLGYLYFRSSAESDALASIGLIAFVGVAQFSPALILGLFWRNATVKGAISGMTAGFLVWGYTLFLPSLVETGGLVADIVENGLFGIALLKPGAFLGLSGLDPLVHTVFWSLGLNTLLIFVVSLWTTQSPLEKLQSALFVDAFRNLPGTESRVLQRETTTRELYWLTQRILGADQTRALFNQMSKNSIDHHSRDIPDPHFVASIERHLAGNIGASAARTLVSQIATGETISLEEIINLVDETQQVVEYSRRLEHQSKELRSTAEQLRDANRTLQELDVHKDEFLSQVSHELRTPMTSIRSMSEILLENDSLEPQQRVRFNKIIHEESLRLTRLLDQILEVSRFEHGEMEILCKEVNPESIIEKAIDTCRGIATRNGVDLKLHQRAGRVIIIGDADRFHQVMINLVTNAVQYNNNPKPMVEITSLCAEKFYEVYVRDNGQGVSDKTTLFNKFSRGVEQVSTSSGAGLGLSISRQLIEKMNGSLDLIDEAGAGACFRIRLPL
jgi:Na+/proline symporter/signal transduction histidine kinase